MLKRTNIMIITIQKKDKQKEIQVWPSPDVMEKMGAKDALCKIAKLNIGLEDRGTARRDGDPRVCAACKRWTPTRPAALSAGGCRAAKKGALPRKNKK